MILHKLFVGNVSCDLYLFVRYLIVFYFRLSAVFGGIYALNQELQGVVIDKENNFKAIICNGQRIAANNVVIGLDKAPEDFIKSFKSASFISRGIFITNR